MRCPIARTLLTEYLENTLNPTTKRELEEHLATCTDCQNLLKERQAVMGLSTDAINPAANEPAVPSATDNDAPAPSSRSKNRSSRSSGSSRKGKEKFAPRSSQRTDEVRKRLESAGVLVPDTSEAVVSSVPSRENSSVISSGQVTAFEETAPLQQLMQRYTQQGQDASAASTANGSSARNSRRQRAQENASRQAERRDQPREPVNVHVEAEPEPVVEVLPMGGKPSAGSLSSSDPRERIFLITPADEDKSDDALWVDILVTHHVTRQQVQKRVRRDSSDAQRYFAAFGLDPMNMQPIPIEGGSVQQSHGQDQLRPRPEMEVPVQPIALAQTFASDGAKPTLPAVPIVIQEQEDSEEDELFSALLGYSLPDQNPEEARVVVAADYVPPVEPVQHQGSETPLITPAFSTPPDTDSGLDSAARPSHDNSAIIEALEHEDAFGALVDAENLARASALATQQDASVSLHVQSTVVASAQASALPGTQAIGEDFALGDSSVDAFRIFLPADDAEEEEDHVTVVDEEADADDAYQFVLPNEYNPAARSQPRPPTPAQTNPIVSRPAEIGRERLVNQSRYGRTEAHIIGRDSSAGSRDSMSFGRMQWFEGLKRNPYGLVMLVGALILILFLVIGVLISQMNAPWAQAKAKLDSDMSLWENVLHVAAETNTVIGLTFPEPFILGADGDDTPLRLQLRGINSLYNALSDTLQCWEQDVTNDDLLEQRAQLLAEIQPSLTIISEQLRALEFPQGEEDWLYTTHLIEPVETLAHRYLTYGISNSYNNPSSTLSKEQLQAVVRPGPLNIQYADRVFSLRSPLDEWHLITRVVGGTGEYAVIVDDLHQTIADMQAIGEPSLHVGFDVLAMEQWLSGLMPNPYYFLGETHVNKAVGTRSLWFAPMRNLRLWMSEPLQLVLNEQGFIEHFKVYSLDKGEEHTLEPDTMDLFQAASLARSDLFLPPADGEEIYLVESGSVLANYPALMWYYRCYTEMGWQIRVVDADGSKEASSIIESLVHYFVVDSA